MAVEFALARSVRDTATLLDAVWGPAPGDPYAAPPQAVPYAEVAASPPGSLRVGAWTSIESLDATVAPDCVDAVATALRALESLGHRVEPSRPAALGDAELAPFILRIIAAGQTRCIDRFGESLGRPLGPEDMDCDNWALGEIGRGVSAAAYVEAVEACHAFARRVAAWWSEGFDLLVTPTIPEPPPPLGELVPDPARPLAGFIRSGQLTPYVIPFNVTGQPAISLPLYWNAEGLPIGVQLVAAFGREDLLLQVAAQLEEALPWRDRRPPIHAADDRREIPLSDEAPPFRSANARNRVRLSRRRSTA